jgi:soluble lytic murein transglycosylase
MIIPHVPFKTKRFNLVFSIALPLFFFSPSPAQTLQELHARLRSASDAGDNSGALAELSALRSANPALFAANNYDYLLGRLLEKKGDGAGASANYHSVVARGSALAQYALWHQAQLARSTGDLLLEREHLRRLLTSSPNTLLRDAATMRLGHSFLESQDYVASITSLRPLSESKNNNTAREALGLIAQAYIKGGKQQEARATFQRLLMQMPDASRPDDFALAAVLGLDVLDAGRPDSTQTGVAQLTESEHLLRASVYQFNRDFDAARLHYLALVERYPQSPTFANELYQIGRGFYLEGRYEEALKYFQRVLNQFPDSMNARDALAFTAGAFNRLKRTDDALAAYKRFIGQFPDAPNPERSYLNIIDALHEAGRYKEALDWVQQTRTRFRDQLGDALALFAQTRIHLAQTHWQAVVADTNELGKFSDLGGIRVPGGTSQSEIVFLRAYALEQLGKTNEAISEYLSLPDGRHEYYGRRATERLLLLGTEARTNSEIRARAASSRAAAEKAIAAKQFDSARRSAQDALRITQDPATKKSLLGLLSRAYDALSAYRLPAFKLMMLGRKEVMTIPPEGDNREANHRVLADELLFLGLYDEGVVEFDAIGSESPAAAAGKPNQKNNSGPAARESASGVSSLADSDYTLAVYARLGGLANRAVRFGEQIWKPVPSDYVLDVAPRELLDLLYPLPYRESLLKHVTTRGIDPRFVISIARQESRFQAEAKSVAAARGLMQFIPATATDVAGQLKLTGFDQDDLYNPDTAILFGSQYLAGLFRQFSTMPEAVAASYNGGPENVSRWVARSHSNEPIRYVPEIGFPQTKDYVFKVMTNFWVYQQLYDEKLERR